MQIDEAIEAIKKNNSGIRNHTDLLSRTGRLQKVLIANRGEIAKRFFLSLKEEGILSVAVVTDPDKGQTWYEMADQVIMIGEASNYTNIATIIAATIISGANAIYPGYGFLSENPNFVEAIDAAYSEKLTDKPIIFMGPSATIMRKVGNKLDARQLAKQYGIPLFDGTENINQIETAKLEASRIGYPVIVKLNAGGGGKGMQAVYSENQLPEAIESCQRIGRILYKDDTYYLEKYIEKPVHIEVQIFNGIAVGIRKCAVQRRNQKIIEESGDEFLSNHARLALLAAAENMARISGYDNGAGAGTVEFLYDPDSDQMGFLEMNTRLQVEHPVTDQSLGIDLAQWQILEFDGRQSEIPFLRVLEKRFIHKQHTIECRIYAEDSENHYTPSPGKIDDLELPTFNGIRCDFGFRRGDRILPDYDPMIGKLIATGESRKEALLRMERSLNELYIRGITTNQYQLLRIIRSTQFQDGNYTNRLLDDHPELSQPVFDKILFQQSAIFAALSENINLIKEKKDEVFINQDLEAVIHRLDLLSLPEAYDVEIQDHFYEVRFFQISLTRFYVYLNRIFQGEIELLPALSSTNDYTFRFEYRSYSVRVDRRSSFHIVRFPDLNGRIHFMKLKIINRGATKTGDSPGLVRSPIQGSFVKFHIAKNGKSVYRGLQVNKGEPIIVLSAMKMESTIVAPVDGIISYLIEDGDLARLELGKTSDDRVIGRSITEGEVLFVIETNTDNTENQKPQYTNSIKEAELPANINPAYLHIFKDDFQNQLLENPDQALAFILEVARLFYLGLNIEAIELIQSIKELLKSLPDNYDLSRIINEKHFTELLATFTENKRLFSPISGGNVSYFREIHRLFGRWNDVSYQLPSPFKYTVQNIFQSYNVTDWRSTAEYESSLTRTAFLFVLRSFHSTRDLPDYILHILKQIGNFRKPSNQLKNILRKLVLQEEAEQEHSIAATGTETLNKLGLRSWNIEMTYWVSRKYLSDLKKLKSNPFSFSHIDHHSLRQNLNQSLMTPITELIPSNVTGILKEELERKLHALQQKHIIQRLYSPKDKIAMYLVTDSTGNQRYFALGLIDEVTPLYDSENRLIGSESVERIDIDAVRVMNAYQSIRYLHNNVVDMVIADESACFDLSSTEPTIYSYSVMMNMVVRLIPFFNDSAIQMNIMSIRAKSSVTGQMTRKWIYANTKNGRIILNLLAEIDHKNPYSITELDKKTNHLFTQGKWPADLWIQECFDSDKVKEVLLPSIDGNEKKRIPVGSRIYTGLVRGSDAVFYFKDSRIAGGSTGDLEGRKYIAACWLAITKGWPLYIWNDGAGANIKQGMVALNRAAEGFFLNALIGARLTPRQAYSEIQKHPDVIVKQIVDETTQELKLESAFEFPPATPTYSVAVGVGSSTGLDVYGSSQSAIQVMIDDEQSFRVLTGSAVIKSVTGEDLTNYEIGGARIMSRVTGTVDRVARSNLHLITVIHELHELFTNKKQLNSIRRTSKSYKFSLDVDDVIIPTIVQLNVDDGRYLQFKEEYYGSGVLTGGFARLAGQPTLIMGPRSKMGLRSFQSLTRACELLLTARKLSANQIVVVGDEWFSETPRTDAATLQTRKDFLKLMSEKSGLRIHIATTVNGLRHIMLHSAADALIFVNSTEPTQREKEIINNTATHIVKSLTEAFDLAVSIQNLLNCCSVENIAHESATKPSLPDDATQPFDMIESVIQPVFDENSFIEWWGPMNTQLHGPSLITGFALINSQPVAIIADQPGGAPDALGTQKFRWFTELVERNQLPIVMLSNAPGFMPGTRQERLRIQQIGGRSLDVNVLSTVPVVSVVLQQNFGGRQIHAFSKFLRPNIQSIALSNSTLAVMGSSSAFDLFEGKNYQQLIRQAKTNGAKLEEAENLRNQFIADFQFKSRADQDALSTGVLDQVIESITDLRPTIIQLLKQHQSEEI